MQRLVRFLTTAGVLVTLVGGASAQGGGGLNEALDQQRLDLERQQSESRREIEAQQRALGRQEDHALQQGLRSSGQLPPRESPVPPRVIRR